MSRVLAYHDMIRGMLLHSKPTVSRLGEPKTKGILMSFAKTLALTALLTLPVAAEAKPPLRDVKEIDNELYYIAIANEISDYCPSISGRRLKAIGVMWGLKSKANNLGYSDTEIRAYVESDAEKDRMRAKGKAFLAQQGVTYDNPNSFCTLGRAEIERNSAIGVYLRAN
ncbi:DUF5333 domain-containing protein [Rhodobacteraceae bacterium B1Z28]|uniref:DUF5333 domain-containing protein n=2 Tax=Ruegeria haliotis TaxID=2747601 RepID=A0ABX2PN32_9RHOB|nr:DUF5333 domain-containing protein [Ruegeria haliotis]